MARKLYQFPISHYCEKVRWALDYKRLPYQKVNLLPGPHVRKVLSMAKRSSVPVLEDGGELIQGSANIIDYLDQTYPDHALTPSDPLMAATARQWEQRLDDVAGPAVRTFVYHYMLRYPSVIVPLLTAKQNPMIRVMFYAGYRKLANTMRGWMDINEASAHRAMDDMDKILSELRQIYANTRYLVGNQFSRADLAACALFAPLFQPNGYGLKWTGLEKAPPEMREWIDSHEGALSSIAMRYEQNR